jgi:N-acetylglutamate synthase/N-acetylornithine aminotransferase
MSILAAIRREEKKVKKQLAKLQSHLHGLESAAQALGKSTVRDIAGAKKSLISAVARAKMSKAAKKRWATIKAGAKKAAA